MDMITSTASSSFTSDTTFYNYLLIVYAYSKTKKLYGMQKFPTEEVIDKMDMFLSKFEKKTDLDCGT